MRMLRIPMVDRDPVEPGAEVVVSGRVRRRFFRAGGVTQSRTEVVADAVVATRQAKRARSLVSAAARRLQ